MRAEQRNLIFYISYGCEGSKIRSFIQNNYHQWNVKNWIELATEKFVSMNVGKIFKVKYTPKNDLGGLHTVEAIIMALEGDKSNGKYAITQDKETKNVLAKVVIQIQLPSVMEYYGIFGGGGNEFFFGGDFEAEKVEDSDWYDVKRFALTHLFFMDRLGRKYEMFKTI
jgi:hypothetical protein